MAIGLAPNFDPLNENGFPLDKEGDAIFTNTIAVSRRREVNQGSGERKGIFRRSIKNQFTCDSFSQVLWKVFELSFAAMGKVNCVHGEYYSDSSSF